MNFLLPIIAHLLGDFILQSTAMATKKRDQIKYFLWHCLIYAVLLILALIWFGPVNNMIFAVLIIVLSHLSIDYSRTRLLQYYAAKQPDLAKTDFFLFVADQFLHILIILACGFYLTETSGLGESVLGRISVDLTGPELYNGAVLILLYILCLSPAAIFIKKILILFHFQNQEDTNELIKSGYLIGVLERVITLTLWLNGQLGAIGFVLAAKSLARFSQLNDRDFAEKYLVGTLLSIVIALGCITLGNALLIIR
ncbi:DUF3307 domain-containing protein [Dehalobacter sp. TBBPA1]|uniref:DUF3307 domain-containing protein n=1 Tax=Dehalobacter sp. TBBPA1 TaxID=3235037 RepID=UPI0034A17D10